MGLVLECRNRFLFVFITTAICIMVPLNTQNALVGPVVMKFWPIAVSCVKPCVGPQIGNTCMITAGTVYIYWMLRPEYWSPCNAIPNGTYPGWSRVNGGVNTKYDFGQRNNYAIEITREFAIVKEICSCNSNFSASTNCSQNLELFGKHMEGNNDRTEFLL